MKSKSMVAAMALMLSMGASGVAFAQQPAQETVTLNTEQVEVMQKMKKSNRLNNFEGLVLTDSQLQAIDQLNQKVAQNKPQKKDIKASKEIKASKNAASQAECQQSVEARQKAGREYLEGVQEILTPDQYVTYLENIVLTPQKPMKQQAFRQNGSDKQMAGTNSSKNIMKKGLQNRAQKRMQKVANQVSAKAE